MTERQFSEIERALLAIGDAASRTRRALEAISADGAEPHVADALSTAYETLQGAYRDLTHGTYYAVPAVADSPSATKSLQTAGSMPRHR